MTAPLATRHDLDHLRCDAEGCDCDDELVISCREHDAGVYPVYSKGGGLVLECCERGQVIATVLVAG